MSVTSSAARCDRAAAVTRSLLGYGVLAGPFYVVVGLVQGLTRTGFDLTRHDLSLLANGPLGWIQIANLVLSGLMTIAAAVGIRRALRGRRGGTWRPTLVGGYGLGLVAAGAFVADPMNGFPAGTPDRPAAASVHGTLHLVCGGAGFLCLIAATFVLAQAFPATRAAWYSRISGIAFLAGFAGIASGSDNPAVVLGFWAAVIIGWAWLGVLSAQLYRVTPHPARLRESLTPGSADKPRTHDGP